MRVIKVSDIIHVKEATVVWSVLTQVFWDVFMQTLCAYMLGRGTPNMVVRVTYERGYFLIVSI